MMKLQRFYRCLFPIAAVLRILGIWKPALWYDENFTLLLTRLPFERMIHATMGDVHPPLYYLLVWPIGQLWPAAPAWVIRLPSVVFSMLALWLFVQVMKRLHVTPAWQMIAASLMTVLPFQLHYAQEARMYALLELLVVAAALCVIERRWVWLFVTSTAMLYTQNYALFYLPVIALFGLLRHRRADWPAMLISLATAGVAWLPWAGVIAAQMQVIGDNYWIFPSTPGGILYTLYQLFWAFSVPHEIQIQVMALTYAWLMAAIALTMRKMVLSWRSMNRRRSLRARYNVMSVLHDEDMTALLFGFGPVALAVIVSVIWNPVLLFRPLAGTTPFLILLCAKPLAALVTMRDRLFAAAFLAPVLVMSVAGFYAFTERQKEGAGSPINALHYIEAHWQPGDVLYHAGDGTIVNWLPYASKQIVNILKPDCESRPYGALSPMTRAALGVTIAPLEQVDYTRAWVVWGWTPLIPACEYDYMRAIIGESDPLVKIQDDKFIQAGVWLVETNYVRK
jgi:hypothetical protein